MAEVKWIKIVTDIFDDEKMLLIESLPSADSLIVIWFKLLCLAGKNNNDGVFVLNDKIPYTEEMLATIFRRDINTVRLALKSFEDFGMIEIINGVITIPNWNKHQTLDSYEKKKERDRLYMAERRAKQKALAQMSSDKSSNSNTTPSSDVVISEEDIEKDIDITLKSNKRPPKKKYGEYKHVLLTDDEYNRLCDDFTFLTANDAIKFLDEYIEEKGNKYKSHNMAIRRWVIDAVKERERKRKSGSSNNKFNQMIKSNYDFDAIEKEILQ